MKAREKFENCLRVLMLMHKPDQEEFVRNAKICALGIVVIGLIGFLVHFLFRFIA